jgi:hypothetical protein
MLVIAGILVTMENFGVVKGVSFHWPILLTITGSGFMMLYFERYRNDYVLMWIGTFLFLLSLFFYYLNAFSWKMLSSLWPVFLGAVGFSFLSISIVSRKVLFAYFASVFIALFIIFTLVFTISVKLWPMSLAVFGLSLIIIEYIHARLSE